MSKKNVLQSLLSRSRTSRKPARGRALALEPLENRNLLSTVSVAGVAEQGVTGGFTEDGSGSFVFSLSETATEDVTISYSITHSSDATYGDDSSCVGGDFSIDDNGFDEGDMSGSITIEQGYSSVILSVDGTNDFQDPIYENHLDENVTVTITDAYSGCDGEGEEPDVGTASATLTIIDDDPKPTVSVIGVTNTVEGGDAGQFTIKISDKFEESSSNPIVVTYSFLGTATAGTDYSHPSTPNASGQYTYQFTQPDTTYDIVISPIDDTNDEYVQDVDLTIALQGDHYLSTSNTAELLIGDNDGSNNAPVSELDYYSFSVPDNQSSGYTVGTVTGLDGDNDTLTYELKDNPYGFSINPNTGEITTTEDHDDLWDEYFHYAPLTTGATIKVLISDSVNTAIEVEVYVELS